MIICPSCKEEIEDASQYCDQCGQALAYCSRCGRVGLGRRCTYCGAVMVGKEGMENQPSADQHTVLGAVPAYTHVAEPMAARPADMSGFPPIADSPFPTLMLINPSLNIRITGINGAVIGRRQGPYQAMFVDNKYVSGCHAQLTYRPDSGWCITDKHSSNGTKLNQRDLQPDIPMSIKDGDIVTLANIPLQVSIRK